MAGVMGSRGASSSPLRLQLLLSLSLCLMMTGVATALPAGHSSLATADETAAEAGMEVTREDEPRATWLETRNLESNFKQLVYLSLQELASEGRVDPQVLAERLRDKRGRHQGFCFRKAKSGRFLPYICWKGENERDEK
jgi:hypothetical protein